MSNFWYAEWSSHVPVAVRNNATGERHWFDQLPEDRKAEALTLPVFDLTSKRFVLDGGRQHAFVMHRRQIRF